MPLPYGRGKLLHDLFGTHSDNGFYDAGDEFAQPYQDDSWYEDLQDASCLDTYPYTGLVSRPCPATEESVSLAMVMQRATEILELQLPSQRIKTNC